MLRALVTHQYSSGLFVRRFDGPSYWRGLGQSLVEEHLRTTATIGICKRVPVWSISPFIHALRHLLGSPLMSVVIRRAVVIGIWVKCARSSRWAVVIYKRIGIHTRNINWHLSIVIIIITSMHDSGIIDLTHSMIEPVINCKLVLIGFPPFLGFYEGRSGQDRLWSSHEVHIREAMMMMRGHDGSIHGLHFYFLACSQIAVFGVIRRSVQIKIECILVRTS